MAATVLAEFIEQFEISSPGYYQRFLLRPIVPPDASGITIGVGYDLGYTTKGQFHADWSSVLYPATWELLATVLGLTGATAKRALPTVAGVTIPYAQAELVFRTRTIPQETQKLLAALPNVIELPSPCLTALVSLSFNRGADFTTDGPRRTEMVQIGSAARAGEWSRVPALLRSMERLWNDGLITRREKEAALFEEGLAEIGFTPPVDPIEPPAPPPVPVDVEPTADQLNSDELSRISATVTLS